ncbi:MAG: hypothetical protein V4594_17385 [Bacteroidota bacterium]
MSEENKGLDNWNERLDKNMESEEHGNSLADIRADDYSNENGSGDQSDDAQIDNAQAVEHDHEDNMAKNHPHSDPEDDLAREE